MACESLNSHLNSADVLHELGKTIMIQGQMNGTFSQLPGLQGVLIPHQHLRLRLKHRLSR